MCDIERKSAEIDRQRESWESVTVDVEKDSSTIVVSVSWLEDVARAFGWAAEMCSHVTGDYREDAKPRYFATVLKSVYDLMDEPAEVVAALVANGGDLREHSVSTPEYAAKVARADVVALLHCIIAAQEMAQAGRREGSPKRVLEALAGMCEVMSNTCRKIPKECALK